MRRIRIIFISLILLQATLICFAQNDTLILNGYYKGKNLIVQNPMNNKNNAFCTKKVFVNGAEQEIDQSLAFEIKLDSSKYHVGDFMEIKIVHENNCAPKFIVYLDNRTTEKLEFEYLTLDSTGLLKWKTIKETEKLIFWIEQYRWNKWVKVAELETTGKWEGSAYEYKLKLHSGENTIRIRMVDYFGKSFLSPSVEVKSNVPIMTVISPLNTTKEIILSDESLFEIHDQYGNMVQKGTDKKVNVSQLSNGSYYLQYDNSTVEFIKR